MNFQFKMKFYPLCTGMGSYSFCSVWRGAGFSWRAGRPLLIIAPCRTPRPPARSGHALQPGWGFWPCFPRCWHRWPCWPKKCEPASWAGSAAWAPQQLQAARSMRPGAMTPPQAPRIASCAAHSGWGCRRCGRPMVFPSPSARRRPFFAMPSAPHPRRDCLSAAARRDFELNCF